MEWLRATVSRLIQYGPVPEHLAIIMDGNRRFAQRAAGGDVRQGHTKGFDKLLEALEWCLDLGIKCVTAYAFSIENFNRSKEEVTALMELAERKLLYLLNEEKEWIEKHSLQICVVGNLALLPQEVQLAANKVMEATCSNSGPTLNICLAYLSSQEMAHALHSPSMADDVSDLPTSLYTKDCPPVDLLVRTSGESRLSDFMLWQSQFALLHFANVLWPDFTFWHLLKALVDYQKAFQTQQTLKTATPSNPSAVPESEESSLEPKKREEFSLRKRKHSQDHSSLLQDSASKIHSLANDSTTEQCNIPGDFRLSAVTNITADSRESQNQVTLSNPEEMLPASQEADNLLQVSGHTDLQKLAITAPVRRNARQALDRRKQGPRNVTILESNNLEEGLFEKPSSPAENRTQQLKRNGIAGGYDSMEDDEDVPHINGCPCCIVKFLPMHRICTDPTPAIRAMRNS